MPISFGKPGALRKTFNDGKFDLVGGVYDKKPCKLKAGEATPAKIKDGQFLAPDGNGEFVQAATAAQSLYMIFTANTEIVIKEVTAADVYPGEDRTDTPTGLVGEIVGIWPEDVLFIGTRDADGAGAGAGAVITLASYTGGLPLTVFEGKLAPANVGGYANERVVGYVEAPATVVGSQSVAARIHI